jgi:peptidoglycan/LPS O-acetylase OafA/YrhL
VVSAAATGWVLLLGVPLVLLTGAGVALARGGAARRGGAALLVWALLVGALLAATAAAQGTGRAADVAAVVAALGTGLAAVPLLVAAAGLRAVANRPAPARPLGCGGCACSAGGCCTCPEPTGHGGRRAGATGSRGRVPGVGPRA